MKEHCFSIAIEAPNNQSDSLVRGRIVRALHQGGFKYQSIKDIAAQDHWNRAAQTNNSDYAAALRVGEEYQRYCVANGIFNAKYDLLGYCEQRLNGAHFA
jgi:hypothetical protein